MALEACPFPEASAVSFAQRLLLPSAEHPKAGSFQSAVAPVVPLLAVPLAAVVLWVADHPLTEALVTLAAEVVDADRATAAEVVLGSFARMMTLAVVQVVLFETPAVDWHFEERRAH